MSDDATNPPLLLSSSVLFWLGLRLVCLLFIGLTISAGLLEPVLAGRRRQRRPKLQIIRNQNRPPRMNHFNIRANRARINIHAVLTGVVLRNDLPTWGAITHKPTLSACVFAPLPVRITFPQCIRP